ncbi:MAG: zf-TFIIB domain-containing protein [Nocardioides sp.]
MTSEPPPFPGAPRTNKFTCPKCADPMTTYNRNGVHVEQCDNCRGLFLDFGELEQINQLESQFSAQPPPMNPGSGMAPGPAWGNRGGQRYRKRGLSGMFFSS